MKNEIWKSRTHDPVVIVIVIIIVQGCIVGSWALLVLQTTNLCAIKRTDIVRIFISFTL